MIPKLFYRGEGPVPSPRSMEPAKTWTLRGLLMLNRVLRPLGVMVVPRAPSAKMMREHANVSECHHPSRGGRTVVWMRNVADLMGGDRW